MQLSYRGVRYSQLRESMDGSPEPIELVDSGVTGSYRGHSFQFTYPRHLSASASSLQPARQLTYRGAAYQTTSTGSRVDAPVPVRPAVSRPVRTVADLMGARTAKSVAAVKMASHTATLAAKEYDTIHRRHIQARLQHRIDVARAQGNQHLLQLLEREMQQVG